MRARQESTRAEKGAAAEDQALEYLLQEGLSLIERNFRCRQGEIDLIMRDDDCTVFVEVRFRSSNRFLSAALSVDERKQTKIANTAAYYLGRHPHLCDYPVRFDVIAIDRAGNAPGRIQWMKDAFRV